MAEPASKSSGAAGDELLTGLLFTPVFYVIVGNSAGAAVAAMATECKPEANAQAAPALSKPPA